MLAPPLPRCYLLVPEGTRVKDLVDRAPVDVLNSLQPGPALERLAILPLSGIFTELVRKQAGKAAADKAAASTNSALFLRGIL